MLPGKRYIDVNFVGGSVNLGCVCFRNHYTESVSLKVLSSSPSGEAEGGKSGAAQWRTIVRRHRLMADAHAENEAQDYHVFTRDVFFPEVDVSSVQSLRLVLFQPSPLWREHDVRALRVCSLARRPDARQNRGGGGGGRSEAAPVPGAARATEHLLKLLEASRSIKVENQWFTERNVTRRFDASRYEVTNLKI